jgi:phospholipase/carboxylesterase
MPHQQLDQIAPVALQEELWRRMEGLEHVTTGRSGVSLPESRALHLDPALASGPRSSFLVGTEFAHLHGAQDGSLHAALPEPAAAEAIEKGWAELHPLARDGVVPPTMVMLYGPRNDEELETIWQLVETSYEFACGRLG